MEFGSIESWAESALVLLQKAPHRDTRKKRSKARLFFETQKQVSTQLCRVFQFKFKDSAMPCKIWNKSTFEQHDAFYNMKYFQPKEIKIEDDQNRESQIDTNMI